MKENILIIHGGAPTTVINASLYGVIKAASEHVGVGDILGARCGSGAVLREDFIDLRKIPESELALLPSTPGSAIGTSRDALAEHYDEMARVIKKRGIGVVLYNGGNGSMDACGKLAAACGDGVRIVGIPKTIDNDIAVTDHAPGFGSAARYLIATVREIAEDVRSLPIHVCIIEAMGRNTGWLTAASALAWRHGNGPHMIMPPEIPFEEERFLARSEELFKKHGGVVVVASEGIKHADGEPVSEPVFKSGRSVYYGDVGSHLANLIIKKLGIKARSEKPGIIGRASGAWQSCVDRDGAVLAGKAAFEAAMDGHSRVMVGFERLPGPEYAVKTVLIPIERVMLHERMLPLEYLCEGGEQATKEYLDWCEPLIGGSFPRFAAF